MAVASDVCAGRRLAVRRDARRVTLIGSDRDPRKAAAMASGPRSRIDASGEDHTPAQYDSAVSIMSALDDTGSSDVLTRI
jgi:hypothetical protein